MGKMAGEPMNMEERKMEDFKQESEVLRKKLEESDRTVEKLCERDVVFRTLPYSISAFLSGKSLDEGLENIMNRLERAYAVSGVCLLALHEEEKTATILAASSGCANLPVSIDLRFAPKFPFTLLQEGFMSPFVPTKEAFTDCPEGLNQGNIMCFPVRGKRSFFGSICIIHAGDDRNWDEVETDTLSGVAAVIGYLIEFDELKQQIERDRDNLEALVDERTAELKQTNTALRAEAKRRKKAQFALRSRHKILREMYNRVPIGAVIIQIDGTFDFSNHYFRFMTGYAKKELKELNITDILGDSKANLFDDDHHFRNDMKEIGASIIQNNGKEIDVRINSFPLQNDSDQPGGTVCLFTDLSRQKEREHRERLMKIQLTKISLELDKLKSVVTGDTDKPKNMDIDTFGLTKREKETLLFALQGYRTREISRKMGVVEVTIRKNLTSIFRKLEVRDRYELIEKYRDLVFTKE